jgi:MoxR-like ATPase
MLANRDEVVPVLSLASYYALSPFFLEIEPNVDCGGSGYWSLSLHNFVEPWKRVSEAFSEKVTDKKYTDLTDDEKMDFTKLLFIASVTETTAKNALDMLRTGHRAMILYGPPGTGKTYTAKEVIKQLLGTSDPSKLDDCKFDKLFPEQNSDLGQLPAISEPGCWGLVQFHPTYSYHDFIGGIMPALDSGGELRYIMKKGIFTRFCHAAAANNKPFVLIIDEINRADLSSVFGELMYAIEYRGEEVSIPHFPRFSIPTNVYIIGTMNSTDKSLVAFDLALRRRFLFYKLMPDMVALTDWNSKKSQQVEGENQSPIDEDDLKSFIKGADELNKAILDKVGELGLPEDYGIGQAYFMKIYDFCMEGSESGERDGTRRRIKKFDRERLWIYHLEPLLNEYIGAEMVVKKIALDRVRDKFVNGV